MSDRSSSRHEKRWLANVEDRYGNVTDYDREHARKMHSVQREDVPLGQKAGMAKSIQVLTDTFRPFDRFRKKK